MTVGLKPNKTPERELKKPPRAGSDAGVVRQRNVDPVARLLRSGLIDQGMHDAARAFQTDFADASFDPLHAPCLLRLPGNGGPEELSARQLDARRRVDRAMAALGGHGSPAGSIVWFIVGQGMSIRQWSLRQRWGGRPVRQDQATGALVAGLAMLAGHYGYRSGDP